MKKKKLQSAFLGLPHEQELFNRRAMLKGGISLTGYLSLSNLLLPSALAQSFTLQKKLIWISLSGGWDIIEGTDPKTSSSSGLDMIYDYGLSHQLAGSSDNTARLGRWLPRIASHGQDVVIVRGISMGTTSHDAGRTYMDTGILSNGGTVNAASIPAIVASESAATIPIIQLGGMEPQTDRGLLNPVSVVRANNLELYREMYPTADDEKARKLAMLQHLRNSVTRVQSRIEKSAAEEIDRLASLAAAESKITTQFANNVGEKLSLTDEEVASFNTGIPANVNAGSTQSFSLALKLVKEGICDCVNLGIGGFDTHSNQTANLEPRMAQVDFSISQLVQGLKDANMLDNTLVVVYSDFGRTPKINGSNGRDHWPVGGALMIGGGIQGGRVVGGTDADLRALKANLTTGALDDSGTNISPIHLGGSVLQLTLGSDYLQYRTYLEAIGALTQLKG